MSKTISILFSESSSLSARQALSALGPPISVGARQLVRQDGGSGGPFYGAQPPQPTHTRAPTGERLPISAASGAPGFSTPHIVCGPGMRSGPPVLTLDDKTNTIVA